MVLYKASASNLVSCISGQAYSNLQSLLPNNMAPREEPQRSEAIAPPTTPDTDRVDKIARSLAEDIVQCAVIRKKGGKMPTSPDKYCSTMRRTVSEISARHEILFKGMMSRLTITPETCQRAYRNIADEIFVDGSRNWGRIVTLYAFGACLAQYWVDKQMESHTGVIAEVVADYVEQNLNDWILKQTDHWDAFVEYFPEPTKLEDKMRKGLMWTAAFGLGALGILAAVR